MQTHESRPVLMPSKHNWHPLNYNSNTLVKLSNWYQIQMNKSSWQVTLKSFLLYFSLIFPRRAYVLPTLLSIAVIPWSIAKTDLLHRLKSIVETRRAKANSTNLIGEPIVKNKSFVMLNCHHFSPSQHYTEPGQVKLYSTLEKSVTLNTMKSKVR